MITIIKHILPEEQAEAMERIELFTERRGKYSSLLTKLVLLPNFNQNNI